MSRATPGAARPRRPRALTLTAGLAVLMGLAAEPVRLQDLTPTIRARIDRLAARQPPPGPLEKNAQLTGTLTARLLGQLTLTAEDEFEHAAAVRKDILRKKRTVPAPDAARRVWRKLLDALPAHLEPDVFEYTLTVLDERGERAFTSGGGYVYAPRALVEELLAGGRRGEAALAFTLAGQLGHMARLHCRRGWQLLELQDEIKQGVRTRLGPGRLRRALETGIDTTGGFVSFLYSRAQVAEADLFALHLCRNAGFSQDAALDALRLRAARQYPRLLTDETYQPDKPPAVADPLHRLRRLLEERDGLADEKKYGMFVYDPKEETLGRCRRGLVGAGQRSVVFVHGMKGGKEDFRAYLTFLGGRTDLAGRKLLVFRYPNDDSLARAGELLASEMRRVVAAPRKAFFVGHSAGGLVFRYYAEVRKGGFDRAILLSTPHKGSDLADLKFLVELAGLDHDLRAGLPDCLDRAVPEGSGQMLYDVHPDSLFLRYLGRDARLAERYHVFSGRCLDTGAALAVRLGFGVGRRVLERRAAPRVRSPLLRREFLRRLRDFRVPEEVTRGDLVVSVRSSTLRGAGRVTHTRLTHNAFKTDEGVIRQVAEEILEEP